MEEIKIGITGSRYKRSITEFHNKNLHVIFLGFHGLHNFGTANVSVHHGDCTGVDEYCHDLAIKYGMYTVAYPPKNKAYRAFTLNNEIKGEREYLERNKDIVNEVDLLLAVSATENATGRSGTWSTIRYANKINKPVYVILPSGKSIYNKEVSNLSETYKNILGVT